MIRNEPVLSRVLVGPVVVLVGALVSIIPLLVAFLSLQRFWRSGLGSGGLK